MATTMLPREKILLAWSKLDQASYYEILSVAPGVDRDTLQRAFHRFALAYHPDRHIDESEEIRDLARRVFQRGVEAYSALRDAKAVALYANCLASGRKRFSIDDMEHLGRPEPKEGPSRNVPTAATFAQQMKTEDGREVAERIERLMAEKRFTVAYQQLGVLESLEPDNPAVGARLQQLRAILKARS